MRVTQKKASRRAQRQYPRKKRKRNLVGKSGLTQEEFVEWMRMVRET